MWAADMIKGASAEFSDPVTWSTALIANILWRGRNFPKGRLLQLDLLSYSGMSPCHGEQSCKHQPCKPVYFIVSTAAVHSTDGNIISDTFLPTQKNDHLDALTRHYALVHTQTHAGGEAERRRVAQACKPCNLAKLRCDGQRPCGRCRRCGDQCYYEERQKRRTTARPSSSSLPQSKRHQAQAPSLGNEIQSPSSIQRDQFQNPDTYTTCITDNEVMTGMNVERHSLSQCSTGLPDPNSFLKDRLDEATTQNTALNDEQPPEPRPPRWETLLGVEDLDIGAGLDATIWSDVLDSHSSLRFDNIWLASTQPPMMPDIEAGPSQMPTPLTPTTLAAIYNRGCSPRPVDPEAIEPRQYHPTVIDIDAQLAFPDLQQTSTVHIDFEDLAHVQETQQDVVDQVTKLAADLESKPLFPPFRALRIPPASILNAWTQLYFEHFHPIFPILHKASFGYPDTHWLLVFTVSAIGAQFSRISHAQTCSRAMHEMIRRQSMYLCENQNKNGREIWLTQVILLNHIGLRYSGERRALEIAELLQALPVTLARRKQLFTNILSTRKLSELDLSLRQKWQIWNLDDERRRVGFAIWLVDSFFQSHFDLTPVLSVGELNNFLPRGEDRWSAMSAGGWASYSTHFGSFAIPVLRRPSSHHETVSHVCLESEGHLTLQQVIADGTWVAAWNTTGVIGKQVLLQLLMNIVSYNTEHVLSCQARSTLTQSDAEGLLKHFLAALEDEEVSGTSAAEQKACSTYRLMIFSTLMSRNSPRFSLLATSMRIRYQHCDDNELGELAKEWNKAPQERRRAALHAAQVIESVRSQYCAHFSTPVLLFRATLTLWLYTILDRTSSDQQDTAASSVVLGGSVMCDSTQERWVESGNGRVKLKGVGNISAPDGRKRLLDESISVMHTLRSWGISTIYGQLLCQLREA
ncbi:uncharacterized protein KD926_000190 [Aspergillus affinis]|uniref:uncharacterized protein n=1 Tax=Aspergillus affinis TaxID=1070780 RepID=UPI0022FF2FDA|nr:uncharacterized protein KD926_000190 [Aspergillus affinis]KAI9037628.1 hypothetical protein KD926_000190 [Aspergillus affinis]